MNGELLIEKSMGVISELETGDGGYRASFSREYEDLWTNDIMYMALAREAVGDMASVEKSYNFLFRIFLKHRDRLDKVTEQHQIPENDKDFFPSKYKLGTLEPEKEWGHHQLDVIGLFNYNVARLKSKGLNLVTNGERKDLMKQFFQYCIDVKCFEKGDNGRWEEWREPHVSSMGALLAGLRKMKKDPDFDYIGISDEFMEFGRRQMYKILPRESPPNPHPYYYADKTCDSSQLSLIWPFKIIDPAMEDIILGNIETRLVRDKGIIRYRNDRYFGHVMGEAQWPKFFGDLSIIYARRGNRENALHNLKRMIDCLVDDGEGRLVSPEAYHWVDSELVPNPNTPLGWNHADMVIALTEYMGRFGALPDNLFKFRGQL